ncbi:MAG: N-acetyltransferase DgcN [Minwuia sp.]|uniref:N-acetyltransferase DgcN n=1 Tax=Minwuia sp. TaxID=2493630 RepID=UPI003A8BD985
MDIQSPYLMFLGDVHDQLAAKTATGVVHWRRGDCIGQVRFENCGADLGLEDMDIAAGKAAGARTLVIGAVNPGGVLPDHWVAAIVEALEAGMDVASGLHTRLTSNETVAATAKRLGRRLFDVRHADGTFPTGKGTKRTGKRLLTVGTDCSVGKMYTSLAIAAELRARGVAADFRATGQTGILIEGTGVSVDAVVSDFISGATEGLSPDNDPDHWDIVEGQGSLFHPSFAGVTIGLIHGSQPDALVMCHEPTRKKMRNVEHPIPDIRKCIEAHVEAARLTNPDVRCIGVAVNTSALDDVGATDCLKSIEQETGLPTVDPVRTGVARLVDALP